MLQRRCRGFLRTTLLTAIFNANVATADHSLLDAYNMALASDTQLAVAKATIEASRENVVQRRAMLLPNIGLKASTQHTKASIETTTATNMKSSYNSYGWGATLNQPIFNMSSWFKVDQAKSARTQAEEVFASEQQKLIVRISEAYFNALKAKDSLIASKSQEKAVMRQLDQARERFNVGLVAETDVIEAQAAFDSARVARIHTGNQLSVSYEGLRTIVNREITEIAKLGKNMPVLAPVPTGSAEWVNTAIKNNLSLRAARAGLKTSEDNLSVAKSGHAPTVNAFATYNYNSSDENQNNPNITGKSNQTVVGVQFELPIFSGGATSSAVRQAGYQMQQAQHNYDKTLRETSSNTRNLLQTATSDVERVKARCQGIISSESVLKATKSGYEVGTRNITDVLNAQQKLYSSSSEYSNALYDYIINTIKLKEVVGILSLDDLRALDKWMTGASSSQELPIPAECQSSR